LVPPADNGETFVTNITDFRREVAKEGEKKRQGRVDKFKTKSMQLKDASNSEPPAPRPRKVSKKLLAPPPLETTREPASAPLETTYTPPTIAGPHAGHAWVKLEQAHVEGARGGFGKMSSKDASRKCKVACSCGVELQQGGEKKVGKRNHLPTCKRLIAIQQLTGKRS